VANTLRSTIAFTLNFVIIKLVVQYFITHCKFNASIVLRSTSKFTNPFQYGDAKQTVKFIID
jgi:hypothetical protein